MDRIEMLRNRKLIALGAVAAFALTGFLAGRLGYALGFLLGSH